MSRYHRLLALIHTIILFSAAHAAAQPDSTAAASSSLNGVRLPAGAARLNDDKVPADVTRTLAKLVAHGGEKVRQGGSEVLVWTGSRYRKSNTPQLIGQVAENLQGSGWTYEVAEENGDFTVFSSLNNAERRGIMGFWIASNEALMIAWTEMVPADTATAAARPVNTSPKAVAMADTGSILRVGKDDGYVNVMGDEMPAMPQFPALSRKPGVVRGYVRDWAGKPLSGAAIGVRASYFAGQYSGAQGRTDAKGYYEFVVPKGSAHFYNAGYAMEWAGGIAAVGLHPADGQLDSWVTSDGAVENFVLLPYGITSRAHAQDNPRNPGTYYGGSIYISYGAYEASDNRPYAGYVPENSTIEITLASESGRSFVIHKKAGFQSLFRINNIPLGRYKISARVNGKSLRLKQGGLARPPFGLSPQETNGEATITFAPDTAKSDYVSPQSGTWKPVEVSIAMP